MVRIYMSEFGPIPADLDTLPVATVTKTETASGYWRGIEGRFVIGKTYPYIPSTRGNNRFFNKIREEFFECEVILCYDGHKFAFVPVELLDLGQGDGNASKSFSA